MIRFKKNSFRIEISFDIYMLKDVKVGPFERIKVPIPKNDM